MKIEKKDMLYWILILILFIVWIITVKLGDDSSSIQYIWFASSISSLLLATLSILYSYFQNFSINSANDKLQMLISEMWTNVSSIHTGVKEIKDGIDEKKKFFSEEVNQDIVRDTNTKSTDNYSKSSVIKNIISIPMNKRLIKNLVKQEGKKIDIFEFAKSLSVENGKIIDRRRDFNTWAIVSTIGFLNKQWLITYDSIEDSVEISIKEIDPELKKAIKQ